MFQTVREVSDYYLDRKPTNFWPSFHAAVACGVVGRVLEANRFFAQVLHLSDNDVEWVKAGQTSAAHWMSMVHDTDLFRQNVRDAHRKNDAEIQMFNAFLAGMRGFGGRDVNRDVADKRDLLLLRFLSEREISIARQQRVNLDEIAATNAKGKFLTSPTA